MLYLINQTEAVMYPRSDGGGVYLFLYLLKPGRHLLVIQAAQVLLCQVILGRVVRVSGQYGTTGLWTLQ